jgi:hypothetical protein
MFTRQRINAGSKLIEKKEKFSSGAISEKMVFTLIECVPRIMYWELVG